MFSSTFFSRAGTPALRKYFCASTSAATCDQASGTSMSSAWNTTEPSGLRISLVVRRNVDVRIGRLACLWCSAARSASSCPFSLLPAGPRDVPRTYRPPTSFSRARTCPVRASPGLTRLCSSQFDALFRPSGPVASDRPVVTHRRRARPGGTPCLSPAPLRRAERLRRTLSGERPAGLRTTRAERTEARTNSPSPSRPSARILNQPLNLVGMCEMRGKNRCGAQVSEIQGRFGRGTWGQRCRRSVIPGHCQGDEKLVSRRIEGPLR